MNQVGHIDTDGYDSTDRPQRRAAPLSRQNHVSGQRTYFFFLSHWFLTCGPSLVITVPQVQAEDNEQSDIEGETLGGTPEGPGMGGHGRRRGPADEGPATPGEVVLGRRHWGGGTGEETFMWDFYFYYHQLPDKQF